MADIVFKLKPAPTEADAERLVEAVENMNGVTEATLDTATCRLFVTFDTMRMGDIELERTLKDNGFEVATEDEVGFMSDVPGYTQDADKQEQDQAAATDMTRMNEIDLNGGLGAEST